MSQTLSFRQSGLLLHPTSLPGPYGVGDLGRAAHRFVDFLHASGQRIWQVLPLNPIAHGNSPYASPSAFAGNTLLISVDGLLEDGLLSVKDLNAMPDFPRGRVDFGGVMDHRRALFDRAFAAFTQGAGHKSSAYTRFCKQAQPWLEDHALFHALMLAHDHKPFPSWEPALAAHKPAAVAKARKQHQQQVDRECFLQWVLHRQWQQLRAHARANDVTLVGDAPIFVAYDSAEVWAHRPLFKLDDAGQRTVVAGVPPDYFSEDGQLWGNPLYDWEAMAQDGFSWWVERIRTLLQMVDVVRIDHFRGFAAAWEVPASARTARKGRWVPGPGRAVFDAIHKALGDIPLVAEDLGIITPDVEALRDDLGLPGMKILQFAFGDPTGINAYLPHNHTPGCVVYTGTHDNDTTAGWFQALDTATRTHVQMYLGRDGHDVAWDMIRLGMMSVANTAIFPVQDLLSLGTEARFNTPGIGANNWEWRLPEGALDSAVADRLGDLTRLYARHAGAQEALAREAQERAAAAKATADDEP